MNWSIFMHLGCAFWKWSRLNILTASAPILLRYTSYFSTTFLLFFKFFHDQHDIFIKLLFVIPMGNITFNIWFRIYSCAFQLLHMLRWCWFRMLVLLFSYRDMLIHSIQTYLEICFLYCKYRLQLGDGNFEPLIYKWVNLG